MSSPTLKKDLTRWNRARLEKFQYIDGNAATFLEDLREFLRLQFNNNATVLQWLGDEANDATLQKWQDRLLEQYYSSRRDLVWEMLRSFARSLHLLTYTADAYANEKYLGTATQWDNVRRLVKMLDYHPAPPASAETHVALFAKEDKEAIGRVDQGLALQNSPDDGSAPLTFETLEDTEVDYRLNHLKAPDYQRSPDVFTINTLYFDYFVDELPDDINVGDRTIISDLYQAIACEVKNIFSHSIQLKVIEHGFTSITFSVADMRLHWPAKWKAMPKLNGSGVVSLNKAANVSIGDVMGYLHANNYYYPKRIEAVDGDRIRVNSTSYLANEELFLATRVEAQATDKGSRFVLPTTRKYYWPWKDNESMNYVSPQVQYVNDNSSDGVLYHYVSGSSASAIHYLAQGTPASFKVIDTNPSALSFEGTPEDLLSDQWLLLKNDEGEFFTRKLIAINEQEKQFTLQVLNLPSGQTWTQAEGVFENQIPTLDYNKNYTVIYSNSTKTTSEIIVALDSLPECLSLGRPIWLVSDYDSQLTTLIDAKLDSFNGELTLTVSPSLEGKYFPKYSTDAFANVALCGHGETKDDNVLGNGNRILSNQSFIYKKTDVAFIQDTQFSSGVKASIEVYADQRQWTQVENLRDSEATDTHYQVELTEDNYLQVTFGDGQHGQRLPSGTNNVRIKARFGHGLQGNLPAYSLDKLKKPHVLIDDVLQPQSATGGGDLESTESLRSNAPASVLTLSRAVSTSDFAALAKRQSSIWHAKAYALPEIPGATDRIQLVVVPAGGGPLGSQAQSLASTLKNQAQPGVTISVIDYQAILLPLSIKIRVDEKAYDPQAIAIAVKEALINEFSLQNAAFDRIVYRSKIYHCVESVEGVENADCVILHNQIVDESGALLSDVQMYIGDDNYARKITPKQNQIIYVNHDILPIVIETEAFHE